MAVCVAGTMPVPSPHEYVTSYVRALHVPDNDVAPDSPVTVKNCVASVPPDLLYPVLHVIVTLGTLLVLLTLTVPHVPFVAEHVTWVHCAYSVVLLVNVVFAGKAPVAGIFCVSPDVEV